MTPSQITAHRLANQAIIAFPWKTPVEVVRHLGAIQAQDYLGALWSVGLRLPKVTEADVEQALADGEIIRTWPMRGTLHLVAREDARWMLELLASRVLASTATRQRELEIDAQMLARCEKLFTTALQGRRALSRDALMALMADSGISPAHQRGYHILRHFALERLICFGPREGKQQTLVLFEEWVPDTPAKSREDALTELARRYFASHGPATLVDFAWWSGLKISEARSALESIAHTLQSAQVGKVTYWFASDRKPAPLGNSALLPGFDEYLLGYKDRTLAVEAALLKRVVPGNNGLFLPTLVRNGQVIGTWKRTLRKKALTLTAELFTPLKAAEQRAFAPLARRYGEFIGVADTAFSI